MSLFARRDAGNTALLEFPLSAHDLNQTGKSYGSDPQDATLEGSDYVRVREDPVPPLTFGQEAVPGTPTKRANGHWHRPWTVVDPSPTRANELQAQLKDLASQVAAGKRLELTTAHVLTFMELDKLAADPTPTAAEYPLIAAIAQGRADGGRPTTFAQAVTGAQNFRTNWVVRAAQVERKYHEILARIDNATTLAQARAILAELEELA